MKTIITHGILAETQCRCDKHPNRECYSELRIRSWYGSNFDKTGLELHMCDECLSEMYIAVNKLFGVKPTDIVI